eukprot:scaffold304135_cov33-Tisochrysis_lutea.AAC.1
MSGVATCPRPLETRKFCAYAGLTATRSPARPRPLTSSLRTTCREGGRRRLERGSARTVPGLAPLRCGRKAAKQRAAGYEYTAPPRCPHPLPFPFRSLSPRPPSRRSALRLTSIRTPKACSPFTANTSPRATSSPDLRPCRSRPAAQTHLSPPDAPSPSPARAYTIQSSMACS